MLADSAAIATMFLAIKGVQQVSEVDDHGTTFSGLFTNAIFQYIVISLAATIGLYIVTSLIYVHGLFGIIDGH